MQTSRGQFQDLKELANHVGQELGLSDWTTVTQEQINQFAITTGDEQWIHIDPKRCELESPYKKPIAHGFLILSLTSKLCHQCYEVDSVGMVVNYGLNKVRFPHPTVAGSKIRARVSLVEMHDRDPGTLVKLNVVLEIENVSKPACVAEWVLLLYEKMPL